MCDNNEREELQEEVNEVPEPVDPFAKPEYYPGIERFSDSED